MSQNIKSYMPLFTVAILSFVGLTGVALYTKAPKESEVLAREFVCYDDGELVERHVLVKEAGDRSIPGSWYITYQDGQRAIYRQPEGETCQVEEIIRQE